MAVVAPYGDGGAHARAYARHGWEPLAVTLPAGALPPYQRQRPYVTGYRREIHHDGGLRQFLKRLRARDVTAVVAGSGLGVALADRIARGLGLPGGDPATSEMRTDRGRQAAALAAAGIAAPSTLRTQSLVEALEWAAPNCPAYVVAPADSSATEPPVLCSTPEDIGAVWEGMRNAAREQTGTGDLVVQEAVVGAQYLVHCIRQPWITGDADTAITSISAELRITVRVHSRSDLISPSSLTFRSLSLYTARVMSALDIHGAARLRVAFTAHRGPVLLSARAWAHSTATDHLPDPSNGTGHFSAAAAATVSGHLPQPHADEPRHVAVVSLRAPHNGVLDGPLLRTVTTLPTVQYVQGALAGGAAVRQTVDRATSPGRLVLADNSLRALDQDYRVIRAVEQMGLYRGAAR
ncbi:hypothetical protein [Streptomyces sp. NPDC059881]|uniref:hypothetical protein n=1 Tax=Streptomyces sp. NPDC059881 TaxID=3346986 RepID=UPI003646B529